MTAQNFVAGKAGVSLKFIVVGAGLAGLGAAYTLRKAGHDVLLIEATDGLYRSSGGLRSPPNMTKVLSQWGLGPKLAEFSTRTDRLWFNDADTGSKVGLVARDVLHEICKDCLAEFLFLEHGLVISWLQSLAKQVGVNFRFNTKVVGAVPEDGYVILENGERLQADLIIGADGINSVMRQYMDEDNLVDESKKQQEKQSFMHCTFSIPLDELDDELLALAEADEWHQWIGAGVVVGANVQMTERGKEYTVTMAYDIPGEHPEELQEWGTMGEFSDYGIDITRFERRAQKLLRLAKDVSGRIYPAKPCLDSLVCADSRIILIGEAAHTFAPGGSIAPSLCVEDAQTLGCLFARIQSRDQIQQFVTAYDEIRHPRAAFAYDHDANTQTMLKLPACEYRDMRNAQLSRTIKGVGEEEIVQLFGNDLTLYAHDARNEVAAWWIDYGQIIMKADQRHSILSGMHVSVAVS